MSPPRDRALERIARLLRDREMARLAELQAEQRQLTAQREALQAQARASRQAGQESLELFSAAERFSTWAQRKDAALLKQMHALQGRIDGQLPATARAVGRDENIRKVFEQMRQQQKDLRQRRNGV